jgi:uncharacterized membrane protein YcaP (DUF421 family)
MDWANDMQFWLDVVFGSSAEVITWWQMSLRAVVIFIYGIIIFRFAYKRMFGQSTDFDIVVVVLIGSTMSRTLTGNSRLLPTLAATTLLVVLHAVLARLAWHWSKIGWLTKGAEIRLIDGGQMNREAMREAGITDHDLLEAARLRGTEDLSRIDAAVLERNGRISVVLKRQTGN